MDDLTQSLLQVPRSALLEYNIGLYKEMQQDANYVTEDMDIHTKIGNTVFANFGGALIRSIMGPTFDCTPDNLFKHDWAPLVCQLNLMRWGNIRGCYPRIDYKTVIKVFGTENFPTGSRLMSINDDTFLPLMHEYLEFLKSKGM
jgi:hypothetical protein